MKKAVLVTLVAPLLAAAPAIAQQNGDTSRSDSEEIQAVPGYAALTAGNFQAAETTLARDSATAIDPARMINLGYVYMSTGREQSARILFQRVRDDFEPVDVELANGDQTDTHVVAIRALTRLNRALASR